jgi:hypothetical protein
MPANARDGYTPLSDLGRRLLPALAREAVERREQRTAKIVQLLPHGHPTRLRVVSPDEVAVALESKPPSEKGKTP